MEQIDRLKVKGRIGIVTTITFLISYIVYFFCLYEFNYRLDQVYFVINTMTISIFSWLLFQFFKNLDVKVTLLFSCIFSAGLTITYIGYYLILGTPYITLKWALIAGLLIGTIYYLNVRRTFKH